jgi:hypothetical protein
MLGIYEAYLALAQPLAWTAYVSGTLLLLWVTDLGIAQTTRQRADSDADRAGRTPAAVR